MIKFDKVYVKFVNDFYSLYELSCEINSNSFLVEKNLCGATAFMHTLSKINKEYQGEIFVDNVNIKNIKDKDLKIAYLPEKPILFKNKSIKYNLTFPLKIRKINKKIAKNLINDTFLTLKNKKFNFLEHYFDKNSNDLTNILKLKTKILSLSEQKILTLIRTVLHTPKYVLLENFFKDLDEKFVPLALILLEMLYKKSLIIAFEKDETKSKFFKDFNSILLK